MYRVLLPFDNSAAAMNAVRYVVNFSKQLSSPLKVELLHVEGTPHNFGDFNGVALLEHMRQELSEHGRSVLDKAESVLKAAQIQSTQHVEFGNPAKVINEIAQQLDCQHIVMGTHGMGELGNLFLGSVAMKVVHLAKVPVTLIK